ncbi:MAG TPA: SDR family oxidoreductase [Gammaproteobacteria bacterium]|nr:SDR family oxidoreductase [Gammaproteobacteria bacterium]
MVKTICILGFGYTATFLAKDLLKFDFSITGTSRNPEKRQHYKEIGYAVVDFMPLEVEEILKLSTHLLILIPPDPILGDPIINNFLLLLKKYRHQFEWVGYASSTGVYGDHDGNWVDEMTVPRNLGIRAKLRLESEAAWLSIAKQFELPLHIFRLAGIYGPYRNVLKDIANGKTQSIYKAGHFFSRIHVEDIAKIIIASIQQPKPGSIYNIADNLPASSYEVDQYATSLLEKYVLTVVPFEEAILSDMSKEFYKHNRRVSNAKIKEEFKLQLNYPSYREGLMQIYHKGDY